MLPRSTFAEGAEHCNWTKVQCRSEAAGETLYSELAGRLSGRDQKRVSDMSEHLDKDLADRAIQGSFNHVPTH